MLAYSGGSGRLKTSKSNSRNEGLHLNDYVLVMYTVTTSSHTTMMAYTAQQSTKQPCLLVSNYTNQLLLTLHIQSEVACSSPCLIVAHHLVHSTVTPGGAGDGDGADRGGYLTTTGDDLAISGPGEVGCVRKGIKLKLKGEVFSFQHSGELAWEEGVCRRVYMVENTHCSRHK